MSQQELIERVKEVLADMENYEHCMSLCVSEDGLFVELRLDSSQSTYGEWIEGEGGDIGLLRDIETKKVCGVHLPLLNSKLAVFHDGPLKINEGFRKRGDDGLEYRCGDCGSKLTLVRPGKHQCDSLECNQRRKSE